MKEIFESLNLIFHNPTGAGGEKHNSGTSGWDSSKRLGESSALLLLWHNKAYAESLATTSVFIIVVSILNECFPFTFKQINSILFDQEYEWQTFVPRLARGSCFR